MSAVWLWPAGLFAAFAALPPVLLHLVRRQQRQHTLLATQRWVPASPRARQRLRLRDRLLLLIRILLVLAVAAWLARPAWQITTGPVRQVLVWPGVSATALATQRAHAGDAPVQWLQRGFPDVDAAPAPTATAPDAASLLRQWDAEGPPNTALEVWLPAWITPLDPQRLALRRAVQWRVLEELTPPPALPASTPDPWPGPLAIAHAAELDPASLRQLRAWAAAWGVAAATPPAEPAPLPLLPLEGTQPLPASTLRVWAGAGSPPPALQQAVAAGARVLVLSDARWPSPEAPSVPLFVDHDPATPWATRWRQGEGWVLQVHRPLDPQRWPDLLEPDWPSRLHAALWPASSPAPLPIAAASVAPLHAPESTATPAPPVPLDPAWALVLAALFLLERIWAWRSARQPEGA